MSDWIKRFIPFASLIALCVIIAVLEPRFLSSGNLASVARQTAVIMIMAIGMTIVMVSGGRKPVWHYPDSALDCSDCGVGNSLRIVEHTAGTLLLRHRQQR